MCPSSLPPFLFLFFPFLAKGADKMEKKKEEEKLMEGGD